MLLRQIDEAYRRSSWHGPNLRGALRGIGPTEAAWRPGPGRHNVWELALHAAYWKYAARRQLTGQKRDSFTLAGSNWFERPSPASAGERAWREDLALLEREHRALRSSVENVADQELASKPRGSRRTREQLIWGIAAHDVYHAGQVQLVKALRRARGAGGRGKG
jgi:uncharacterized damage-inducible protein DinB